MIGLRLTTLDLFSGIGGFARGLEATDFFETSCFVENEPYCQSVLRHHWPEVPILGDIRDVKGSDLPTRPDVICGGFPCQPFSHAGKQLAQADPRHLWPEMLRLIGECRPTWVIGENVTGLIRLGLDEVLSGLAAEGYSTRTFNIPACAVGAPHIRQRLFIISHSDSESEPDKPFDGGPGSGQLGFEFGGSEASPHGSDSDESGSHRATEHGQDAKHGQAQLRDKQVGESGQVGQDVANPQRKAKGRGRISGSRKDSGQNGEGLSDQSGRLGEVVANTDRDDGRRGGGTKSSGREPRMEHWSGGEGSRSEVWWEVEPPVGRVVDGLPNRVSQLRALGNSIVPQIAQKIGEAIKETYNANGQDS